MGEPDPNLLSINTATVRAQWRLPELPDLPPFQGGAIGLFGYDLCHRLERLPQPAAAFLPAATPPRPTRRGWRSAS